MRRSGARSVSDMNLAMSQFAGACRPVEGTVEHDRIEERDANRHGNARHRTESGVLGNIGPGTDMAEGSPVLEIFGEEIFSAHARSRIRYIQQ